MRTVRQSTRFATESVCLLLKLDPNTWAIIPCHGRAWVGALGRVCRVVTQSGVQTQKEMNPQVRLPGGLLP